MTPGGSYIPFPMASLDFACRELGKIKNDDPMADTKPVSRSTALRHIRAGDFKARKCMRGKQGRWIVSTWSLSRYVKRETQRKRNGQDQKG